MNALLRLMMTFSAISLFMVVYLIQNKINPFPGFVGSNDLVAFFIYCLIPIATALISLQVARALAPSELRMAKHLETSNNDFLSNYLAFFFVALSINDNTTFWFIFSITALFTFFSRVSYFNPLYLLLGFHFFYIVTGEDTKILLITRSKLKNPKGLKPCQVRRINDYTYIEI